MSPDLSCSPLVSGLYEITIRHQRLAPRSYGFTANAFWLALDLDELPTIFATIKGFGTEWWQPFRWRDKDIFPDANAPGTSTVKERISHWLVQQGVTVPPARMMWLGHPAVLGYGYNPASFVFCWDAHHQLLGTILIVENTFHDIKPFWVPADHEQPQVCQATLKKAFYVSPFLNLDDDFVCRLAAPDETLRLHITTQRDGTPLMISDVSGTLIPLTTTHLWRLGCRYPLVPWGVMAAIHGNAAILWLKGIPFLDKTAVSTQQKGVLRWGPMPSWFQCVMAKFVQSMVGLFPAQPMVASVQMPTSSLGAPYGAYSSQSSESSS